MFLKNFKFIWGLIIVFIFTGCHQEKISNDNEKGNNVSLKTAENVASFYIHKNEQMPKSRSGESKAIKTSFSIIDENSSPVMHVINYDGGGYIIVSGDNRIEPILAYSDEGYFDENEANYPKGLISWIKYIKAKINYIRENNVTAPEELVTHWNASSQIGISRSIPSTEFSCEETGDILDSQIVRTLLSTTWHQEETFNEYMITHECEGKYVHADVGCVPLAIGQIMMYWRFPTSYNWNSMPNNLGSPATRTLLNNIYNTIDIYHNFDIDCEGTGIENFNNLDNVFTLHFGYKSAIVDDYDREIVASELFTYRRPVILGGKSSGKGHAWVCDGAHEWEACIKTDDGDYAARYLQFHMNWGWKNGEYNGWYGYAGFEIPDESLNYDEELCMIYNIVPNI